MLGNAPFRIAQVLALGIAATAVLAAALPAPASAHTCYSATPWECGSCADSNHFGMHYGPGGVIWCEGNGGQAWTPGRVEPPARLPWVLLREVLPGGGA